jgi:N-acetyl-gamma-glutamyl-phosphate reductase
MRGIYASIYIHTDSKALNNDIFQEFYKESPSVKVIEDIPKISDVVNTNKCEISLFNTSVDGQYLVITAIDNLLKGASGQAIQCFNLMFGLELEESF